MVPFGLVWTPFGAISGRPPGEASRGLYEDLCDSGPFWASRGSKGGPKGGSKKGPFGALLGGPGGPYRAYIGLYRAIWPI